jgi:Lon protease-like protein
MIFAPNEVPIFPLDLVLFPDSLLPLKIFEPRYVDMVSACLREKKEFGVVLMKSGRETRGPVSFHEVGTLAYIETFDQGEDGLLHIVAKGTSLFEVIKSEQRKDGLNVATIDPVITNQDDGTSEIELSRLSKLLSEVLESLAEMAPPKPWYLDDAAWVAYRLAELLPLNNEDRLEILLSPTADGKIKKISAHINSGTNSTL